MSLSSKILLIIFGLIFVGSIAFTIYYQHEISKQQNAIQTQIVQQQQLVNGLVRSQSQWATKDDITQFAKDNNINLQAIEDNLDKLSAQVASINVISATSSGQQGSDLPATNTGPTNPAPSSPVTVNCPSGGSVTCPDADPFGYQKAQQNLQLNEDFATLKAPIGVVGFSAWQKDAWDISIYPREYNVDTIVGTDANGRQYFYNKFTLNVNGQTLDIPIKTATTKQQYPTSKFTFWNPRVLMGVDGGINLSHIQGEFSPNINLGIMSYGQFLTTPDFSVLEVGAAYQTVNKKAALSITPFAYNIGKNLLSPLMNNTYVGPSVQMATDGSFSVGAGLRVGF